MFDSEIISQWQTVTQQKRFIFRVTKIFQYVS